MKRILIALSLAAFVAGCASDRHESMGTPANESQTTTGTADATLSTEDSNFAKQARQSGIVEVELGKLAAKNTKNDAVRGLGSKLVTDHTQVNKELDQIMSRKGVSPNGTLDESARAPLNRLAELKDSEFDQAFKQQAIQTHEKAVALFQKQSESGTDGDLKAFAQKHLPHLREHLEMAQKLGGKDATQTDYDDVGQTKSNTDSPPQAPK